MSESSVMDTVVVEVPVTLRIAVGFPEGVPADADHAARALAAEAAKSITHMSQPRLRAFNEVHRIHPVGEGVLESVESELPALAD